MGASRIRVAKYPGALGHVIYAEIPPPDSGRVLVTGHGDRFAVDDDAVVVAAHFGWGRTHHRIILEQMGKGAVIGEVVYRYHLDTGEGLIFTECPEDVAADAAETVDAYAYCHCLSPFEFTLLVKIGFT